MPKDRQPDNAVEDDDPEAPLYSRVPLDTDEGKTVIRQQNVGQAGYLRGLVERGARPTA